MSKNASTVSLLRGIRAKNGSGQSNNSASKKLFVRPFEDDYGNNNETFIKTEFKENVDNEKSNLIIANNEMMVDTNATTNTTIERSCIKQETSELLNINNNVIVQDKKLFKVCT